MHTTHHPSYALTYILAIRQLFLICIPTRMDQTDVSMASLGWNKSFVFFITRFTIYWPFPLDHHLRDAYIIFPGAFFVSPLQLKCSILLCILLYFIFGKNIWKVKWNWFLWSQRSPSSNPHWDYKWYIL